jgi:hypothetical protein
MRRLISGLAVIAGLGLSLPAVAGDSEVTPEAQAAIEKALADMGCTSYEIEATDDGGYEADDSQCADGQYDILFDKDLKVIEKRKE